jgi:hypothetical protein
MPGKVVTIRSGSRLPCNERFETRRDVLSQTLVCRASHHVGIFAASAMLCDQDAADRRATPSRKGIGRSRDQVTESTCGATKIPGCYPMEGRQL